MFRNIPVRYFLIIGFLFCGLIPVMIVALISFSAGKAALKEQAFRQLESVRNMKKAHIEKFFYERRGDVNLLIENPYAVEAVRRLGICRGKENPEICSAAFSEYAPFFEKYIKNYGYSDIFFVDPLTRRPFFSVKKHPNSASSPTIERTAAAALSSGVIITDMTYDKALLGITQFAAAPVKEGTEIIAVALLQISIQSIDDIMRERSGMGNTGEAYLIGADRLMRSDSSIDPSGHSVEASFKGNIANNGADTKAAAAVLSGQSGSEIITDYHGNSVLSSYTAIDFSGVRWGLIAEIDEAEIDRQISDTLNPKIRILLAISFIVILLLAGIVSYLISRNIREMKSGLSGLVTGVLSGNLSMRINPQLISSDFRDVVTGTNQLADAFARHIEEKTKLEELMQHRARLESIGTLAGGIAHDFNNILSAILAHGYIISDSVGNNSSAASGIKEIISGIDRAGKLVSQILTFSRQDSPSKKIFDIIPPVNEALRLLSAAMPRNIILEKNIAESPINIKGDPSQLHQIILNLCTNAIHAMKDGGTLTINISREENIVKLSVTDTGSGMTDEVKDRAFEPFFTTKPAGEGTGMGLAVVHGIVMNWNGDITLESKPGAGTVVNIILPLTAEQSAIEPQIDDNADIITGSGRILLVDDDMSVLDGVKYMLETAGYTVTAFSDSHKGKLAFSKTPNEFDLVISDYNMPGLNGLDLAQQIKSVRDNIPIMIITGYYENIEHGKDQTSIVSEILHKPIKRGALTRSVKKFIP